MRLTGITEHKTIKALSNELNSNLAIGEKCNFLMYIELNMFKPGEEGFCHIPKFYLTKISLKHNLSIQ